MQIICKSFLCFFRLAPYVAKRPPCAFDVLHATLASINFKDGILMKKRGAKKRDGNVILFPDLEKKLLEKGLEQLQNENFLEAIELFEEAKKIEPEQGDIQMGLVLAYYEAGFLQEAKQTCKEMLKNGIGEYFQVIELYLMILVQLHEHGEIITTIEALLDEKEIPVEKIAYFSKLLVFSKRMLKDRSNEAENISINEAHTLHLLEGDEKKLILTIAELANKNVRPHVEEIKQYLSKEEGHPFIKTMLLNILKDQEFEKEISVEKFGVVSEVTPTTLPHFFENEQKMEIEAQLSDRLESKDPILFQQIQSLLERHLFLIYPFPLQPNQPTLWASAYHLVGLEFMGGEPSVQQMASLYKVNMSDLTRAQAYIYKLEEISYPII